ncbi:hypothetical protein BS47DRAFT_195884 [Hydnum rufescens UP504]|uniref:RING-type domain-containing protein n=1 Tax=Hydnum rufescens UP504 TaxID=1448309 RepID=A0A9P6E170_9AGAM|nr:hypothetical protein BS47DRAFT_195884 [Hydnum rufescens UP504]
MDPSGPLMAQGNVDSHLPVPNVGASRTSVLRNDQIGNQNGRRAFRLGSPQRSIRHPGDDPRLGENGVEKASPISGPSRTPTQLVASFQYRPIFECNQNAERPLASVPSRARDRPQDHPAQSHPQHEDDDWDIELAKALSLSLQIPGSSNSSPQDHVTSPPDPKIHRSRRSRHSHGYSHHRAGAVYAGVSSQHQCPICLEDMTGRSMIGAPCGHTLCRTCRAKLIRSSDGWPRCHMCRTPYEA